MRGLIGSIDKQVDRVVESVESLRELMEELESQCPGIFGDRVKKLSVSDLIKCASAVGLMLHKLDKESPASVPQAPGPQVVAIEPFDVATDPFDSI